MRSRTARTGVRARRPNLPRTPFVVPGGALLALRTSLRARGLRGLDVLRRSQDRAPPRTA
jgi:hypothetical protein